MYLFWPPTPHNLYLLHSYTFTFCTHTLFSLETPHFLYVHLCAVPTNHTTVCDCVHVRYNILYLLFIYVTELKPLYKFYRSPFNSLSLWVSRGNYILFRFLWIYQKTSPFILRPPPVCFAYLVTPLSRLWRHRGYTFFDSKFFVEVMTAHRHQSDQKQEDYTSNSCSHHNWICMWIAGARGEKKGNKELKVCNKCMCVQRD